MISKPFVKLDIKKGMLDASLFSSEYDDIPR